MKDKTIRYYINNLGEICAGNARYNGIVFLCHKTMENNAIRYYESTGKVDKCFHIQFLER